MENEEVNIQALAQQALDRLSHLDPDLQCNLGTTVLRELRNQGGDSHQALIDRTFEVMGKFPNFARARAAVLIKALKTLTE
jgi:hypothetical protein